jgi:hypothetical protein
VIGHLKGRSVAGRKNRRPIRGCGVDRPHGMDHPSGVQAAGCRRDRLTSWQTVGVYTVTKGSALGQDLRSTTAVDGAIDAAAAKQGGVGRVDDGVDHLVGNVTFDEGDLRHAANVVGSVCRCRGSQR